MSILVKISEAKIPWPITAWPITAWSKTAYPKRAQSKIVKVKKTY
jgi:hypothetical protein